MWKKAIAWFKELPKKKRMLLTVSIILTLFLLVEIPVLAWLSSQRKMAVLANVNAPYTLYLSSGHQEDLVYLDMSSIDVGTPGTEGRETHKDFIFSVQGSWDISSYYLQLAHTTNIPFEYTVYRVKDNGDNDRDIYTQAGYSALSSALQETSVPYITHVKTEDAEKGTLFYYTYRPDAVYSNNNGFGKVMDKSNYVNPQNGTIGTKSDSDTYYVQTYGTGVTERVQKNAVPLYMQSKALQKNAGAVNGKDYCDYYIIRVDWSGAPQLANDKETDMVYITVVSSSVVQEKQQS